jgi:hypothetical protein
MEGFNPFNCDTLKRADCGLKGTGEKRVPVLSADDPERGIVKHLANLRKDRALCHHVSGEPEDVRTLLAPENLAAIVPV